MCTVEYSSILIAPSRPGQHKDPNFSLKRAVLDGAFQAGPSFTQFCGGKMATLDDAARTRIIKEQGVSALPKLDGGEHANTPHDHIEVTGEQRGA